MKSLRDTLDVVHDQEHLLEEGADPDDQELLVVAVPLHMIVSGTKATTGI